MRTDRFDGEDLEDLEVSDERLEDAARGSAGDVEGLERFPEHAAGEGEHQGDADDEMIVLRREVAELRDRSVRTLADFDNFRKRVERERRDQQRYAGSQILRDVLDVVDNLERALDSSGAHEDLRSGVDLILRQVVDLLRRYGVERVDAEGCVFDPSVHEAVSREEEVELSVPTVRRELQSGYVMKDRLLRPAMVVVAVPASRGEMEDAE